MAAMEKQGGPLASSASLNALPLFAASEPQRNKERDEVAEKPFQEPAVFIALREMNPDSMTPKQALDALYHLKSLSPPCADDLA
jgi:hypothetical protein